MATLLEAPFYQPEPIRHQVVDDIDSWVLFEKAEGRLYAVGSVSVDQYLIVPESKIDITLRIIGYLDGGHDLPWIQRQLVAELGKKAEVVELFLKLRDAGLIKTALPTGPQSEILRHSVRLFSAGVAPLFARLQPLCVLFSPAAVILGLAFAVAGFAQLHLRELAGPSRQTLFGSYVLGYVAMWLGLLLLVVVHEGFHGLAGLRYGLRPKTITGALYLWFIPYVFISIPGVYTLRPWRRIVVWSAGLYSNLLIGAALQLAFPLLPPASVASQLVAKLIVSNLMIIVFNLSPLMVTDSYFILSTLFKAPNVRTSAFLEFKKWIKRERNGFRGVLVIYFTLSLAMILYCVAIMGQWLRRMGEEILRQGMTAKTLGDLAPLGLIAATMLARKLWRRRLAATAAVAVAGELSTNAAPLG